MGTKINIIKLKEYILPLFKENAYSRENWIPYGKDNLFPLYLVDLFNQSSVHNAVVTGKVKYITGRGLKLMDGADKRSEEFAKRPNSYETIDEIFRKIALDQELFNGFALKIIRSRRGDSIAAIEHVDWTKLRRHSKKRNTFLYSDEWESEYSTTKKRKKKHNPKTREYPKFNPSGKEKVSILYCMDYRPDVSYYPYPEYVGALEEIETTVEIGKFDLNSIVNGFAGGTIINLLNGEPENDEIKQEIIDDFKRELTGSENANQMIINFAESFENRAMVEQINGNDMADRYESLEARVMQNVFIGHKIVSPMLFGVRSEGQLGGRREILEAYELFKETYAIARQNKLVGTLNDILEWAGGTRSLVVEELKPINPRLPLSDEEVSRLITDEAKKRYIQNTYGVDVVEGKPVEDNAVQ